MSSAYHMVHYRRFEATGGPATGHTLEKLCRDALSHTDGGGLALWERLDARLFPLGDEFGGQLLLNKVADLSDSVFGEICYVEQKGLQALLQLKASKQQLSNLTLAEVFELEEHTAPSGSQFIRGLGYWLAIGNHVFFVKTQAMTPDRLHAYLNWLLKSCTTTVDPLMTFNLQAEFDNAVSNLGDIRKLRVSGLRAPAVVAAVGDGGSKEVKTRRRVKDAELQNEQARPIWEAVVGAATTRSFIESLGPGEFIVADTALAIRGKRTEATKNKLKELANDFADRGDEKIQIEGSDGRVSEGDAILRTRMPFIVPHDGSTLLEFDNVSDQLRTVYSRFVQDGKIVA